MGLSLLVVVAETVASMTLPADTFDAGLQLSSASAWIHGQRPNIDFDSVYPPLNTYLIGGFFSLIGESIVTFRLVGTLAYLVVLGALAVFAIRRVAPVRRGFVVIGILLLTVGIWELQVITALMWSTVAVVLILEGRRSIGVRRILQLLLAGVSLGALVCTRSNFAFYVLATLILDECFAIRRGKRLIEVVGVTLVTVGVASAVLAAWGGSVSALLSQTVGAAAKTLVACVYSPVPARLWTFPASWSFFEALGAALPIGWLAVRSREQGERTTAWLWVAAGALTVVWLGLARWAPLVLPAFPALTLLVVAGAARELRALPDEERFLVLLLVVQEHYVCSRPDRVHFVAVFPVLALLLAVAASRLVINWRLGYILAAVCGVPTVLHSRAALDGLVSRGAPVGGMIRMLRSGDAEVFASCTGACATFWPDSDQRGAVSWIRDRAEPAERVFSGVLYFPAQNVYPFNDVSAYWLLHRPFGAHQLLMQSGLDGAVEQASIVRDLESHNVRWLLLYRNDPPPPDPYSLLGSFVRSRYHCAARFGLYEAWQRNEP